MTIQEILQSNEIRLNLGCSIFKIPGMVNIDLDPGVFPDIVLDLNDLNKYFPPNSIDYIQAGHIFEHFNYDESIQIMTKCQKILKPFRMILVVVPDFKKAADLPIVEADRIILGGGQHKIICTASRIHQMLKESGFYSVIEITNLKEAPYLLVPDINNPIPEPWQTAFVAFKIY